MDEKRSIRGRRALVTGAASGIGARDGHAVRAEGASIAATDVGADGLESLVDEVRSAGGDIRSWRMDVADDASVRRVVEQAAAALGGLDILVNCAGVSVPAPFGDEAAWQTDLRGQPERHDAHHPRGAAAPRAVRRGARSSTSRRPRASARRRCSAPTPRASTP